MQRKLFQGILNSIMDDVKFFQNWNISFAARLPLTPSGSPNRSVSRFVAQDRDGRKYIAEGFELRKKSRQIAQTRMLEHLQHRGLAGVFPYFYVFFLASALRHAIMGHVVSKNEQHSERENVKCLKSASSSPQTAPP